jgi:hypothetical protein
MVDILSITAILAGLGALSVSIFTHLKYIQCSTCCTTETRTPGPQTQNREFPLSPVPPRRNSLSPPPQIRRPSQIPVPSPQNSPIRDSVI